MTSGPTVLRYALAVRTARGADDVAHHHQIHRRQRPQRWTVPDRSRAVARRRAGHPGVSFDPRQWPATNRRCDLSAEQRRNLLGQTLSRLIGGAFALGLIGFALLFVWSLWSARP